MGTMGVISSVFSAMMDSVWSGLFSVLRPQQFLVLLNGFDLKTQVYRKTILCNDPF